MASGRFGAVDVPATTETTIYTAPSGKIASATISLCNRTGSTVSVRVAIAAAATATVAEWIEYEAPIAPNGVLERTGLVLNAGERLNVYASAAGVSAVAFGFEE